MDEVRNLLETVVLKEGVQDAEIDLLQKNDKGEGYLGIVTPAVIRGSNKMLKVIVKTAPVGDEIRKHAPLRDCYITEINFYTKLYPILRKFQLDRGDIKPFIHIAKCYGYSLKYNAEGVVMENLKEAGFSVCERRRTMSKEHIKLALEEFARLHALSYALKEHHPKLFKDMTDHMTDNFLSFLRNPDFKQAFDNILNKLIDNPKVKFNNAVVNALTKLRDHYMEFFEEMKIGSSNNKFAVIIHGDCWTNNMMFKYDDVNNPFIPTSMRLIDWQLQKLGSPAEDISYFLYACSDKSIFNNLDDWLKIYHNSLVAQLTRLGCGTNHLSFHDLKAQYEKYAKYGFLFSCLVIKLMLSDSDEVPDLADVSKDAGSALKGFDFESKNEDVYRARVADLAMHAYKFKII